MDSRRRETLTSCRRYAEAKAIAKARKQELAKNTRRKFMREEWVEELARVLAACTLSDDLFYEVNDKHRFVEAKIYRLLGRNNLSTKRTADYRAAILRGLRNPKLVKPRLLLETDGKTIREDLALVFGALSLILTPTKKQKRWTAGAIVTGLAVILEARRARILGEDTFSLSERQIADLASLPRNTVKSPVKTWIGVLVEEDRKGGWGQGASVFSSTELLRDHLDAHPTSPHGNLGIRGQGLRWLLAKALGGTQEIESTPDRLGTKHKVQLQIESNSLLVSPPYGKKELAIELEAGAPTIEPPRIERRPVSWSPCTPLSGHSLKDELQAAIPARLALVKNGLPIDVEGLDSLIVELEASTKANQQILKTNAPDLLDASTYEELRDNLEAQLPKRIRESSPRRLRSLFERAIQDASLNKDIIAPARAWCELLQDKNALGRLEVLRDRLDSDGRSRSLFYDGSARTNRLISTGSRLHGACCLQNIPSKHLERITLAPKGQVFLSADFKALDPHSLAHLSQDPKLIEDLEKDIYTTLGDELGPKGIETSKRRTRWKIGLLGKLYGAETTLIVHALQVDEVTAQAIYRTLESRYSKATQFLEKAATYHKQHGHSQPSITGFIRHGGWAKTVGKNLPISSTSADIARRFETNAFESQKWEQVFSQHDGFSWLIPEDGQEEAKEKIQEVVDSTRQHLAITISLRLSLSTGTRISKEEIPQEQTTLLEGLHGVDET